MKLKFISLEKKIYAEIYERLLKNQIIIFMKFISFNKFKKWIQKRSSIYFYLPWKNIARKSGQIVSFSVEK